VIRALPSTISCKQNLQWNQKTVICCWYIYIPCVQQQQSENFCISRFKTIHHSFPISLPGLAWIQSLNLLHKTSSSSSSQFIVGVFVVVFLLQWYSKILLQVFSVWLWRIDLSNKYYCHDHMLLSFTQMYIIPILLVQQVVHLATVCGAIMTHPWTIASKSIRFITSMPQRGALSLFQPKPHQSSKQWFWSPVQKNQTK